jgi:hypothetical protein
MLIAFEYLIQYPNIAFVNFIILMYLGRNIDKEFLPSV